MPVQYSYTSTPPTDRRACTEPQCLYSIAIPLLPPMDRTACTEPQCLYSTAIPLLPLVSVQYSYTSTPLSSCTVQLYLYSPYGPYGLYRASVPVQGCTLPLSTAYRECVVAACCLITLEVRRNLERNITHIALKARVNIQQ